MDDCIAEFKCSFAAESENDLVNPSSGEMNLNMNSRMLVFVKMDVNKYAVMKISSFTSHYFYIMSSFGMRVGLQIK